MQSLGERKKEAGCSRKTRATDINKSRGKGWTGRRCGKEEITEEERREKWGHTPPGANYERDCTLWRESSVQARGESRWNASVYVWLASQANVYNGQRRRSRDLTLAVSHFRLEAAGQDSGRIKQKLGKQKVAGAASKQRSTRFVFRVCTSLFTSWSSSKRAPQRNRDGRIQSAKNSNNDSNSSSVKEEDKTCATHF